MFSLTGESKGPFSVSVDVEGREGEDNRWPCSDLTSVELQVKAAV